MIDPKCKRCRAAGEKLFLKKDRCYSPKCGMIKKAYPPGLHGRKKRRSSSEFGTLLREKQKIKLTYHLRENQFKKYFKEASKRVGNTGEILLQKLERRLDNAAFRLGFAPSRSVARQLAGHGHFLVNGRRIDIPSYELRKGDVIEIRPGDLGKSPFAELKNSLKKHQVPGWLNLDRDKLKGEVLRLPQAEDIGATFNMNAIIDYYSR